MQWKEEAMKQQDKERESKRGVYVELDLTWKASLR